MCHESIAHTTDSFASKLNRFLNRLIPNTNTTIEYQIRWRIAERKREQRYIIRFFFCILAVCAYTRAHRSHRKHERCEKISKRKKKKMKRKKITTTMAVVVERPHQIFEKPKNKQKQNKWLNWITIPKLHFFFLTLKHFSKL